MSEWHPAFLQLAPMLKWQQLGERFGMSNGARASALSKLLMKTFEPIRAVAVDGKEFRDENKMCAKLLKLVV